MSDIAEIINGYSFRGAIESVKSGDTFVLQAKDIIQGHNITDLDKLTPITFSGIRTASFLQKNDVVIVSRGTGAGSFRSAIFNADGNVIASSSLLILRIKNKEILSEYISLYLNSADGQNKILETVVGSYIHAISRRKFEEDIEIPTPPLQIQQSLISLDKNIKQQETIYEIKKQLKQELVNATIKNLTKK